MVRVRGRGERRPEDLGEDVGKAQFVDSEDESQASAQSDSEADSVSGSGSESDSESENDSVIAASENGEIGAYNDQVDASGKAESDVCRMA